MRKKWNFTLDTRVLRWHANGQFVIYPSPKNPIMDYEVFNGKDIVLFERSKSYNPITVEGLFDA